MPRKLDVNKDEVRTLYISGLPTAEVARRYGLKTFTVQQWANRGKWTEQRDRLKQPIVKAAEMVVRDSIQAQSQRLKSTLASHLCSTAEALESMTPRKELTSLDRHAEVINKLATAASKVHGWAESTGPAVQVNIISQLREQDNQRTVTEEPRAEEKENPTPL